MNKIRQISDYTAAELAAASEWPAIAHYLNLLDRPAATASDRLRLQRHGAWTRAALATYFSPLDDLATTETVCRFWSESADELIAEAWRLSGCEAAGLGLLALGKLGANELNLSSDVDLIAIRPDDVAPDIRAFREFQSLLSDSTAFSFCLRTDFLLRPGGRSSALIPSQTEFEYHYGYHGEMWERLAYVRLRALEGPRDLRESISQFAGKFSYRKHLDYTLIDELKSLRSKIRAEKFETRARCFHLKLGEGGIRELELFVHALQVMHGGRNPQLRTNSTSEALARIKEFKLLPAADCDRLHAAYWYLRALENRVHAHDDQQNYLIDLQKGHPALPAGFQERLEAVRADINAIAGTFFAPEPAPASESPETIPVELEAQRDWLKARGFNDESRNETWPALLAATALSRRSQADESQRLEFLRGFVVKLSETRIDRDLGLSLLLDFVRATRAKASFFTLLNRETKVRDELALLFSVSPYLGSLLISRPELIDEFILKKQAEPSADFGTMLEELAERRLLAELIAANTFLADRDLRKMTVNLSSNADAICLTLLDRIKGEIGTEGPGMIALGKWGGRELGLRSDLDFVFVTPDAPTAEEQKVAKRFLSRITEPHRGGNIYSVDLRLRPSGSSGPIMVAQRELERYLREQAAAWERQAYLRARPLMDLPFHPARAGTGRALSPADLDELRMIRGKLFSFGLPGELDLKLTYGGLADIEFSAQIALLSRKEFSLDPSTSGMIQYLESLDSQWRKVGPRIRNGYERLRVIEQLFQLTTSQSGSKMRLKSDEFKRLALIVDSSADELESRIKGIFAEMSLALGEVNALEA